MLGIKRFDYIFWLIIKSSIPTLLVRTSALYLIFFLVISLILERLKITNKLNILNILNFVKIGTKNLFKKTLIRNMYLSKIFKLLI